MQQNLIKIIIHVARIESTRLV